MSLTIRSLRSLVSIVAFLGLIMVATFAQSAAIASAAAPAKLYLKITVTEPTTTVGQLPKVVFTYGNTGGKTVTNLEFDCSYSSNFDFVLEFVSSTFNPELPQYQRLIPGQNLSDEDTFRAIARGTATVSCRIFGTEEGTGRTVYSNRASFTITVK